jgi:regulator of protease activity HflC (stomatin/prohibitin superfamily)
MTIFVQSDKPLTDEQRSVLPKIQRLMSLAKGNTTEAEAASAVAKAQELLLAYNLDSSMLDQDLEGGQRAKDALRGGFAEYQRDLWREIAELNFCMHWVQQVWEPKIRYTTNAYGERVVKSRGQYAWQHMFIGRKRNVAATIAMGTYLQKRIDDMAMEFVYNDPHMRYSRRANSFREAAAESVIEKLVAKRRELLDAERVKHEEAEARAREAAAKGISTETAVTIASVQQTERDANLEMRYGWEPGTMAKERAVQQAKRAAQAAADAAAEAEYAEWAAAHPEEAAAKEAERLKQEAKDAKKRARRYASAGKSKAYDPQAWAVGRSKGKEIGLDQQTDRNKTAGLL